MTKPVNLRQGTEHTDCYGSLRKCGNPGCDVLYTTREVCRECRRETVGEGSDDSGRD